MRVCGHSARWPFLILADGRARAAVVLWQVLKASGLLHRARAREQRPQWQCGASCVPELVVGMCRCSRVSPRGPWHHRSPRGDLCVWPSTTSSWLQFVVRRSERVCVSSLRGIWPRIRRLRCVAPAYALPVRRGVEPHLWHDAILKEIAILRCPDPKNFLASQGRTVADHELASVTCQLHGLPS